MKNLRIAICFLLAIVFASNLSAQSRVVKNFNKGWKFFLGEANGANENTFNDASWRKLDLPHDWSIELPFDQNSPTGTGGGALRGGLGWYRKEFVLPSSEKLKKIFIDFDGVYMNSEVWINGHSLGIRPNGYISFRYDLTPFLKYGSEKNVIVVKVDNSQQPNSRWYSGSGIFRNVWLVSTAPVFIDLWGTSITTPTVTKESATVNLVTKIRNTTNSAASLTVRTSIYDPSGKMVKVVNNKLNVEANQVNSTIQEISIGKPDLWALDHPAQYKAVSEIVSANKVVDVYITKFGLRYFNFDVDKGFFLNGKSIKIIGVCDHHDLGCLGTAINKRALQRQLEMLKSMGINGIRTSHNPPAPELLDLADEIGFVVMDEAFDMWKKMKNRYDYHLVWDEWHAKDLEDQILRDRNHPSVMIWSIGNEIPEQWAGRDGKDSSGTTIARELAGIVRSLDPYRPITSALNNPFPDNAIYKSGVLDLVGFNYHQEEYKNFPTKFPGKKFIATETVSAIATRGHYDMPSDSIRRWPARWDKPVENANADLTCSAYDNCSVPWGSTQEETLRELLKYDYASGMFIWTGFDYMGEPTPYPWPARSSYFGIIDIAGFPKDTYYLYRSLFTNYPVLHIFPHWNWKPGAPIDVWAYYNRADEVELFLNGKSLGTKKKEGDVYHVMWRLNYEPGILKAVSRKNGKVVLTKEIKTAGAPSQISLKADRSTIHVGGEDLSFITVSILDKDGNLAPYADNDVQFSVSGAGEIAGVENGSETSLQSFKADHRKAFNGLCLLVVRSKENAGTIQIKASAGGLKASNISITTK